VTNEDEFINTLADQNQANTAGIVSLHINEIQASSVYIIAN